MKKLLTDLLRYLFSTLLTISLIEATKRRTKSAKLREGLISSVDLWRHNVVTPEVIDPVMSPFQLGRI